MTSLGCSQDWNSWAKLSSLIRNRLVKNFKMEGAQPFHQPCNYHPTVQERLQPCGVAAPPYPLVVVVVVADLLPLFFVCRQPQENCSLHGSGPKTFDRQLVGLSFFVVVIVAFCINLHQSIAPSAPGTRRPWLGSSTSPQQRDSWGWLGSWKDVEWREDLLRTSGIRRGYCRPVYADSFSTTSSTPNEVQGWTVLRTGSTRGSQGTPTKVHPPQTQSASTPLSSPLLLCFIYIAKMYRSW